MIDKISISKYSGSGGAIYYYCDNDYLDCTLRLTSGTYLA